MLQNIRQNVVKGPVARVIIWLIVISFAAFGIESILLGGSGNSVAEVNGEEISPLELQQAVNNQRRRIIAMLGDQVDPSMLDDQRLNADALQTLISRKLLLQSAGELGLGVSEREIGLLISSMPEFQEQGEFSPELYRALLAESGYTPGYFKQSLQDDMALNQLRSGLAGTEFATPYELELNASIVAEQRDVRYLNIPIDHFREASAPTEGEIEAFYRENESRFLTSESVDLDYIELVPEDFFQPVAEQLILDAYDLEVRDLAGRTEHRVAHILFEAGDQQAERVAQAQSRLAEGVPFSDVVGEFSDDLGSSALGGDLGYTSGEVFPEEMEAAIASLEVGVLSEPVETEAGLHLIMVTDRREAGEPPALEDIRQRLHDDIQSAEARVALLRTVEQLKDLSFNASDLNEPAEELSLTVEQARGIERGRAEGIFANATILSAAYSDDVLQAGHNSEVFEIEPNHFIILRVRAHHQPEVMPLEAVQDDIVTQIGELAARQSVATEARWALTRVREGASLESIALDKGYQWQVELGAQRTSAVLPPEVLDRAFQLPPPEEGSSASDFVMTPSGDALVFELIRVDAGEYEQLEGPLQERIRAQVGQEMGGLVDREFQQGLRKEADITVL